MPYFGSDEMLGATKVPNGDFSFRPPASWVRSSWPWVMWQAEQLPAVNMVSPLARFGVCAAVSSEAGSLRGAVISRPAMTPTTISTPTINKIRLNMASVPPTQFDRHPARAAGRRSYTTLGLLL